MVVDKHVHLPVVLHLWLWAMLIWSKHVTFRWSWTGVGGFGDSLRANAFTAPVYQRMNIKNPIREVPVQNQRSLGPTLAGAVVSELREFLKPVWESQANAWNYQKPVNSQLREFLKPVNYHKSEWIVPSMVGLGIPWLVYPPKLSESPSSTGWFFGWPMVTSWLPTLRYSQFLGPAIAPMSRRRCGGGRAEAPACGLGLTWGTTSRFVGGLTTWPVWTSGMYSQWYWLII